MFIGDCADWKGELHGKPVEIENLYKDRAHAGSAHRARASDIFEKLATRASGKLGGDVIRLEGCPVSVAEQVLALVTIGRLKNPYYDPKNMVTFGARVLRLEGARRAQSLAAQALPAERHVRASAVRLHRSSA